MAEFLSMTLLSAEPVSTAKPQSGLSNDGTTEPDQSFAATLAAEVNGKTPAKSAKAAAKTWQNTASESFDSKELAANQVTSAVDGKNDAIKSVVTEQLEPVDTESLDAKESDPLPTSSEKEPTQQSDWLQLLEKAKSLNERLTQAEQKQTQAKSAEDKSKPESTQDKTEITPAEVRAAQAAATKLQSDQAKAAAVLETQVKSAEKAKVTEQPVGPIVLDKAQLNEQSSEQHLTTEERTALNQLVKSDKTLIGTNDSRGKASTQGSAPQQLLTDSGAKQADSESKLAESKLSEQMKPALSVAIAEDRADKQQIKSQKEVDSVQSKVSPSSEKLSSQHEKVIAQHEKVDAQYEKVLAQNEIVTAQREKVSTQNEKLTAQNEKVLAQHEKVTAQHEKVSAQYEKVSAQHEKVSTQHEKATLQSEIAVTLTEKVIPQSEKPIKTVVQSGQIDLQQPSADATEPAPGIQLAQNKPLLQSEQQVVAKTVATANTQIAATEDADEKSPNNQTAIAEQKAPVQAQSAAVSVAAVAQHNKVVAAEADEELQNTATAAIEPKVSVQAQSAAALVAPVAQHNKAVTSEVKVTTEEVLKQIQTATLSGQSEQGSSSSSSSGESAQQGKTDTLLNGIEQQKGNNPLPTEQNSFSSQLKTNLEKTMAGITVAGREPVSEQSQKQVDQLGQKLNLIQPEASNQLKEKMLMMVKDKVHTAEIRLDPSELGSMQIKISLQQDQMSVQFMVQQGNAKELMEQQMPKLRELLQQQGIELSQGSVQQQNQSSAGQEGGRRSAGGSAAGTAFETSDELVEPAVLPTKNSDRVVDYYA